MLLFPAPRPGAAGWLYCAGSSRPKFGSVTTVNLPKEAEETPAHLSAATCVQRPLPNTVKVWEEKHCPKETDWKPPPSRNGHPGCGWVRAAERTCSFSRPSPHLQRLKGRKGRPSCLGPGALEHEEGGLHRLVPQRQKRNHPHPRQQTSLSLHTCGLGALGVES